MPRMHLKSRIHAISKEREDLSMSYEYADNRPVLMDAKHPTPVKTWDCGGNDVGIVRRSWKARPKMVRVKQAIPTRMY